MMNVSDANCYAKNSFDFEECSAMEIDTWNSRSASLEVVYNNNETTTTTTGSKDDSIITIFAQSIEIFGNTMAPWPTGKSLPEQVAGIFITSESISPKDDSVQSRLEGNKPQIQTKLRRSHSKNRKFSITQVNEEIFVDAQRIYGELEPIPIITAERKLSQPSTEIFDTQKEPRSKASRLQNWLSSLYNKSSSFSGSSSNDEECGFERRKLKGILKKNSQLTSNATQVQKSASISEFEVAKISAKSTTTEGQKLKKAFKLRFDNEVSVCETFHKEDYSRQSLDYVARQLTPSLALTIKKELNALKQEMDVHEDSRHLTQFYLLK